MKEKITLNKFEFNNIKILGGKLKKKVDVKGGNGDIIFNEDGTATKYLRNKSSKEKIERFKKELSVLDLLSKKGIPNIVEIIEINTDDIDNSYVKMKKYDGSLYDIFNITKGNVKLSLNLILPIIKTLKQLSENSPSIYHRDLKPDNILYLKQKNNYELYLTDFGICFFKENHEDTRLTPENVAIGPRLFIAPEYEVGRVEEVNEKGDIFSIGKIIWSMINGEKNEFLPGNFWFYGDYNLQKKFPSDPDIIKVNLIIASCLNINPSERTNYDDLIENITIILYGIKNDIIDDTEKQYRVKLFLEKEKLKTMESLEKNKILVNRFSIAYVNILKTLLTRYGNFPFLSELLNEYSKKTSDGTDYTTSNIDEDASHYLYSKNFRNIYLSINYNPASNGEKFANITLDYIIKSNNQKDTIKFKYDSTQNLVVDYKDEIFLFNENKILDFFENFITNYTKE